MELTVPDKENEKLPPSRRGKRAVTLWLEPAVHRQIKIITAETERSRDDLFKDAINWLFEKHGKPQIA
jgi:hypothetical protein